MRTKSKPLRAPVKTDDWRPNRIRSQAFQHHHAVSPPPRPSSSSSADRTAATTPTSSSRSKTTTPSRQRMRLDRACKDDHAKLSPAMRTRRSSAASSGTAPDSIGSSSPPATGTKGLSTPISSRRLEAKQVSSSPPDLPPDLLRLVHPSSASLGDPAEKPGRGAYRSCDACSRRREKCDRYTVCGSCIIHETICIWSKCKPLYERRGALPGGPSSDDRIARRQAEVDQLRIRIGQLAHRVGLQVEDVLDPEKIRHYLDNGLPPSWSKSGCTQEGAAA